MNISKEQKAEYAALREQEVAAQEERSKFQVLANQKAKKFNDSACANNLDHQIKETLIAIDNDQPGAREKLAALKEERSAMDDLPALIDGYQEKAAAANSRAMVAEHKKINLLTGILEAEADQLGAEYLAAAQVVAEKFRKLLAISHVLSRHGLGFCPTGFNANFNIPVFNLTSHAGQRMPPGGFDWVVSKDIQSNSGNMLSNDVDQVEKEFQSGVSS